MCQGQNIVFVVWSSIRIIRNIYIQFTSIYNGYVQYKSMSTDP